MSDNILAVKEILNIVDMNLDRFLEFCELSIRNKILDRCNINEIPERLNSLIQEFLMEQYHLNKNGIGEGKAEVSSVTDINQTVHFANVGGANSMSQNVDDFLDRNIDVLVQYRKMRW